MTVPRLWEKMEEKIAAIGAQTTGLKRKFADWAKSLSPKGNLNIIQAPTLKLMEGSFQQCGEWEKHWYLTK
jgi:hypothetical protein